MPRHVKQSLAGWGNYHPQEAFVYRPEKQAEVCAVLKQDQAALNDVATSPDLIARGLGRSYGDSSVGSGVILQTRLDCFVDFDSATGVVEAEAGVSLATLIDLLLPRGFFLPVTPGTKFVTLGGAIAADVHGKNHHVDGTIGNYVESLQLMIASGEVLACSPTENADIFWATVGGMGLTGIILSAKLRILPVTSAYVDVAYRRAANLDQALEMFTAGGERKYSVAWIDCIATGPCLGRCVIMDGEHLPVDQLPTKLRDKPLELPKRRKKSVPRFFPSFLLNRFAVKWFNKAYYAKHGEAKRVVDLDSYFYPLDGIHHWNRIYGKKGFIQYQALLPPPTAREGLFELLGKIGESGNASFLAVLKRTGEQGPGLLSYPFAGYTLAIDLKNTGEKLTTLVRTLDSILLKHGGRLYLAKDATMSPETFAAMYPRLAEFREVKARVDPERRFESSQSRRLKISG